MNITEEQRNEIAKRLGITEPKQPEAVKYFLELWNEYEIALDKFERPRFSTWGANKWSNLSDNLDNAQTALESLRDIVQKAVFLKKQQGELHDLASESWIKAQREFDLAIGKEFDRPQNEFNDAKAKLRMSLDKEARYLKSKISRTQKKAYSFGHGTPEREALETEIETMNDRLQVATFLENEAYYVNYDPETSPLFSEAQLWERIQANEYRVNDFLAQIKSIALPEGN